MKLLFLSSLLLSLSQAQYIIDGASFGHNQPISPNKVAIPGWHISGADGYTPQILSDKVILTPPYPGNRRGALWTDGGVNKPEWSADFQFRATGPEHGGGNLQVWYTKEGRAEIGTSSIYTVNKFQGLVLVIDMYGGRGGSIRGFLNDGTIDFKQQHHIESLSFGHCDYSYRNLGRLTKLQLKQDSQGFEVNVDDNLCFKNEKILLPLDNYFGITAASSDNPDSFEIYKFAVSTTPSITREEPRRQQQQQPSLVPFPNQPSSQNPQPNSPSLSSALLDSQLSSLTSRLDNLLASLTTTSTNVNNINTQIPALAAIAAQLKTLNDRLSTLEGQVQNLRNDITLAGKGTEEKVDAMHKRLGDTHERLVDSVHDRLAGLLERRRVRWGIWGALAVVVQVGAVAAWMIYRRERQSGGKKYL
ncbi:hypothetical protein MMC30_005238 [Trapelia coarctata]|nr:hypothetical protein [Trapelia coarctata]